MSVKPTWLPFFKSYRLLQLSEDTATAGFSLFNAGGIIMMIVGIIFSKKLADRFGKRDVFGVSLFLSALCLLAFVFYPPESVSVIFLTQILHGFFYGLTIPLLWAMIADVADFSEWKNNRRATAIIFSAMIFGLKAGLSIGGSLVAGILGGYGYDESLAVQSPEVMEVSNCWSASSLPLLSWPGLDVCSSTPLIRKWKSVLRLSSANVEEQCIKQVKCL